MNIFFPRNSKSWIFLALQVGLCMNVAFAAEDASFVVIEADGVAITASDLEAELKRVPLDVKRSLLFRKDGLAQLASNLLVRRALAKQAAASGAAQDPVNRAALALAGDRILSDAQLAKLDQINKPSDAALEQRARDMYRAEAKRFEIAEEVKASHILILAKEENAEEKINAILDELKAGKDFAELAKAKSQDPGSGAKGGDLGFFARGRMVKEFEETAFAMKVGELSGVIKSQFGYHIITVTERKEAGKQSFEQVRETLMTEANQKILTEGRMKVGDQIMSKAKSYPDKLDAFVANQGKP